MVDKIKKTNQYPTNDIDARFRCHRYDNSVLYTITTEYNKQNLYQLSSALIGGIKDDDKNNIEED